MADAVGTITPVGHKDRSELRQRVASFAEGIGIPDLTLTCGRRLWRVHKPIMTPILSKVAPISSSSGVDLGDAVPSAVNAVVQFIYTAKYDDDDYDIAEYNDNDSLISPLMHNVYVHTLATKCGLSALAYRTAHCFSIQASIKPMMLLSELFAAAVREIFTVTPEFTTRLQKTVVDICLGHAPEILRAEFRDNETAMSMLYLHIQRVASEVPEFATQLSQAEVTAASPSADRSPSPDSSSSRSSSPSGPAARERRFKCPRCLETFIMRASLDKKCYWCPFCGDRRKSFDWIFKHVLKNLPGGTSGVIDEEDQ